LSPGVGVDIEGVAMLCEAIDESAEAGRVLEDGAPLLVGEVGGEDDRAKLVTAAELAGARTSEVGPVATPSSKLARKGIHAGKRLNR